MVVWSEGGLTCPPDFDLFQTFLPVDASLPWSCWPHVHIHHTYVVRYSGGMISPPPFFPPSSYKVPMVVWLEVGLLVPQLRAPATPSHYMLWVKQGETLYTGVWANTPTICCGRGGNPCVTWEFDQDHIYVSSCKIEFDHDQNLGETGIVALIMMTLGSHWFNIGGTILWWDW